MNRQSHSGAWIFLAGYALLAAIYYGYLHTHIPDVPQADDYRAILKPLIAWVEDKSAANFLVQLFSQHNEHRILIVKLVSILFYELEGAVNFKHLILAGNVFFIAFPLVFFLGRAQPPYFYLAILPLFFSATAYASSHWAMTSLSNFPVVLFACMAAYLAFAQDRRLNWLALVLAFLATFSQGNGIVMFFLLTLAAFLRQDRALKTGYLAAFIATLVLFFYNWHRNPINPSLNETFREPLSAVNYTLSLLGSAAFEPGRAAVFAVILLGICVGVRVLRPRLEANDLILLFVVISAAMATTNRLKFGLDSAVASRYTIYSLVLVAVTFLQLGALVQPSRRKFWLFLLLLCASASYAGYSWHETAAQRANLIARISRLSQQADGSFANLYDRGKHLENSKKTLERSAALGIYTPPGD